MNIPQVVHNNHIGFYHLSKWTNLQYHSFIIIKNMIFC